MVVAVTTGKQLSATSLCIDLLLTPVTAHSYGDPSPYTFPSDSSFHPERFHRLSIMIRLPLTPIVLVRADLKDFEKRRRQRDVLNTGKAAKETSKVLELRDKQKEDPIVRVRDRSQYGDVSQLAEADSHTPVIYSPQGYPVPDNETLQRSIPKGPQISAYHKAMAIEHASEPTGPKFFPAAKHPMSLSDPEDDFRFEGFVDCPVSTSTSFISRVCPGVF